MRNQFFSTSGYTGHLLEEEVLGHCVVSWDGQYMPFRQAVQQVEASQPWDPKSPKNPIARILLGEVRKHLPSAEIYCAVGTALDRWHGIDGFFRFEGTMVSMDISLWDKGQYKADLAFHETDLDDIPAFAGRVVGEFQKRRAYALLR